MARLQILRLPETPDDPAPFALVIDQADDLIAEADQAEHDGFAALKAGLGARHLFVTPSTIDLA